MAYDHRIPSQAELRSFSMVWLRAIALAWTACWEWNEGRVKATECKKSSCAGCKFRKELLANPAVALEEWLNYRLPFAINFKVDFAEKLIIGEGARGKDISWDGKQWGKLIPRTHIQFSLLEKPKEEYDEAIAIAAFVSSGPAYLFTCC